MVQITSYNTIRGAVRVVSVVAGVFVAVALASAVGFTWWSLTVVTAAGLLIGRLLRGNAATQRILETLVGTAAGLVGGLIFSPLRVEPAEEAIQDLINQLAELLDQMAGDLDPGPAAPPAGLEAARAPSCPVARGRARGP
ncbi:MAG TPA: hypothetical protein VG253_21900 [Streptosporangiaceae bacterium]|nr:hypothetical protein [Streptosporangiaceae bacterium]